MNEEQNKRELSDAALSAVSGGALPKEQEQEVSKAYYNHRMKICPTCESSYGGNRVCGFVARLEMEIYQFMESGGDPHKAVCSRFSLPR